MSIVLIIIQTLHIMKKQIVSVAFVLAFFLAGDALAQKSSQGETAKGTGTPLGTNLIPSAGVSSESLVPRSGTGINTAFGTGTPTNTNLISPAATGSKNSIVRSATGRETAQGTGTPLGTNLIPANQSEVKRSMPPRSGTGNVSFKNQSVR